MGFLRWLAPAALALLFSVQAAFAQQTIFVPYPQASYTGPALPMVCVTPSTGVLGSCGGGGGGGAVTAALGSYATGFSPDIGTLVNPPATNGSVASASVTALLRGILNAAQSALVNLPATNAKTGAVAGSLVVKAAAGTLFDFSVQADSTLYAANWWILMFDATSLPANGAVTPWACYGPFVGAGQALQGGAFGTGGDAFTTGMVIGVSTTGCFTLTTSAHANFIRGGYQ